MKGSGSASLAKYVELTAEERLGGHFSREIPDDGKNFKVYFRNKYGVWTIPMMPIR